VDVPGVGEDRAATARVVKARSTMFRLVVIVSEEICGQSKV
jgi:hypothetical protein